MRALDLQNTSTSRSSLSESCVIAGIRDTTDKSKRRKIALFRQESDRLVSRSGIKGVITEAEEIPRTHGIASVDKLKQLRKVHVN